MKIYTKKGDEGKTSLFGGERLFKNDTRIEAYGTVDELNAHIGLLRDMVSDKEMKAFLTSIQNQLFCIGSELASAPGKELDIPRIKDGEIEEIEREIDRMEEQLPPLKNFILPGGSELSSQCHVARCVCRRAERRTVTVVRDSGLYGTVLRYLNRLSDYLFVLARYVVHTSGGEEILWKTRG